MIYIRKSTKVSILVQVLCQQIEITTGTYKFPIKFWQNLNEELVKVNILLTSANILKTLRSQSLGHAARHFLEKFLKHWLSLMRYSTLESFSFMC